MDWTNLAGTLIKAGAPAIGTILGGPLGGSIGSVIGNTLATALGTEPTPEAVNNAIVTGDPGAVQAALSAADQKIVAQYEYLQKLAEVQASVAEKQVESVNQAIIAETQAAAAQPNNWWGQWRTIMAYELTAECPLWAAMMFWAIFTGRGGDLVAATSLLTVWWGARFGVLGVHVWTGSNERQAAITGQPVKGALSAIVSAVRKK